MRTRIGRPGFTLLEFFLAIAIFSVLITLSIVVSFNAIARTNLRTSQNTLSQMIRRAQTQSQQNAEGKQWGVHVDDAANTILLFSGNNYTTRDEITASFEVNENIEFSGTLYEKIISPPAKGLVFKRFSGDPLEPRFSGSVVLEMLGATRSISVNGRGVVQK